MDHTNETFEHIDAWSGDHVLVCIFQRVSGVCDELIGGAGADGLQETGMHIRHFLLSVLVGVVGQNVEVF